MRRRLYEITDDSGFMALVDPACYNSFVDHDWTLDQLVRHFKEEMNNGRLVIWGTGREDLWHVEVRFRSSSDTGFREFSTQVRATSDQLFLTNYESLTMAAQFEDVALPERHQRDWLITVTPGLYRCRIIQRYDPAPYDPILRDKKADFLIELTPVETSGEEVGIVTAIPWTDF